MKTHSAKPVDVTRKWHILDAAEAPLGRLATVAASLLLGKHKIDKTPHVDCGDFVIIINSDSLVVTGNKLEGKKYFRHSGFPGGLHERTLSDVLTQDSRQVVRKAVRGMLPDNKLRAGRLERLKIYHGAEHQHTPQKPEAFSLKKESK